MAHLTCVSAGFDSPAGPPKGLACSVRAQGQTSGQPWGKLRVGYLALGQRPGVRSQDLRAALTFLGLGLVNLGAAYICVWMLARTTWMQHSDVRIL